MDSAELEGMVGFVGGKESKLADLYAGHVVETRRLAYLLTGSREAADDLTQDAFIKAFGRLAHLRDPNSFRPYLRRTVVNLAKMQFRRRSIEQRHLERHAAEAPVSGGVEREDDTLREDLMQLPYRQRAAIVLRFYVDLPDQEIGDILGCADGTVRSLISRGLGSLREGARGDARG